MKIRCDKRDITNALNTVMKAVSSKSAMQILECVLIESYDRKIQLTGNDMELAINTGLQGEILESGAIAIEAKLFNEIIRKLNSGNVTIESEDDKYTVKITSGKSKFQLSGRDPEEYVRLPEIDDGFSFEVAQPLLRDLIDKTIFCTSAADNNPMMMSELLKVQGDVFKAVALDGHRIAIKDVELNKNYGDCECIVMGKSLQEISKLMSSDMNDTVDITVTKANMVLRFDDTIIVTRLVGGQYFDWAKVIKADATSIVRAYAKDLMDALGRTSIMVKEGSKKPVVMDIEDDVAKLSVNSEYGTVEEDVSVTKEGKNIHIGMNPKFLMDAINAFEDDELEIRFVNAKSPVFLQKDGISTVYVVLPVNLAN